MLREYLPHVEWTYAASRESAPVLEHNPHVAEVMPIIRGENSWNLTEDGFAELRSRNFDLVLCSNTLRHYPDLALASALGIPHRFGFAGKGFSGLINHPVVMGFPESYPAYFRTMVASVIERPAEWPLRPRVYPSADDDSKATELFDSLGFSGARPVVACSIRGRQGQGNWPEDVLLAIVLKARAQVDFDIVLTGTAHDAGHLNEIAAGFQYPVKVVAGLSRLLTFASFLKRCTALLTLDSGPRHIGNAIGIPVVYTRNLYQSMKETGNYCETETDLAPPVEYLTDAETLRVTRAQPVGLMAEMLLNQVTASGRPG